ncbi:MAG: gamma-glutamyltransferase [Chloroflexota bacterium]
MTRRPMVVGRQGMIATAEPLAALTGMRVLADGGNAVDAAVATAAVLDVTMPMMTGLGGDTFMLVYEAATGSVTAINGSGVAPLGATRDFYTARGYKKMPLDGPLSVAVPGTVDAYVTALERFGSRDLASLLQPAIGYARDGFAINAWTARQIASGADKLRRFPEAARIFLANGEAPHAGDILRQPDLAASLATLAESGRDAFYRGELGERIVAYLQAEGAPLQGSEFASHRSWVGQPIATDYRGYRIHQTPPPSQGLIMLEAMNIAEGFDLAAMGPETAPAVHALVEAKRLAFADRLRYAGDPAFIDFPLRGLLSREYAAERRRRFAPERAMADIPEDDALPFDGDTTSFVIIDAAGNAVSFIESLSLAWGSGVVVPGTGILLNDRAGRGFTLREGHPNCIAPGKRTMHTLNTWLVTRDGKLAMLGNTPGGDGQPQWNMQVLTHVVDFGRTAQEAVEAPRWTSLPGTDPANEDNPVEVVLEDRFPAETVTGLRERGHKTRVVGPWAAGGGAMLITVDPRTGVRAAGCDPRVEGVALAE